VSGVKSSEILELALTRYLGTEAQWCRGALSLNADGTLAEAGRGVSHCGEGALLAAMRDLKVTRYGVVSPESVYPELVAEIKNTLAEQNPEFVEAIRDRRYEMSIALFNDGLISMTERDGKLLLSVPGVGYQGIRTAFEKTLAKLQEAGE